MTTWARVRPTARGVSDAKLLAAVALGDVGMVLSTEAYGCRGQIKTGAIDWTSVQGCRTFIGDAEPIYDVNLTDDQWILGMKGTLSVRELRVLKARLFQGQEHKAQRGELDTLVAPGYLCADGTSLVKDPNRRVPEAIALVLRKLRALWSVRQVFPMVP